MADGALLAGAKPRGYTQVTDVSSAVGLGTLPANPVHYAVIQVLTQPVRWRDDGTDPTSSVGMYLADGDILTYEGALDAIKFIETASGAQLNITFYAAYR